MMLQIEQNSSPQPRSLELLSDKLTAVFLDVADHSRIVRMALVRPSEDGLLCEVCPSLMAGQSHCSIFASLDQGSGHLPLKKEKLTGGLKYPLDQS